MNLFRMASDDGWVIRFERKSGRWVLASRRRWGPWLLVLEWALVTAAACAILMAGLFAGLYRARSDFDLRGKAFADDSTNAIIASMSPGEVFARASPHFIDSASEAFYVDFARLSALGPDGASQGCRGGTRIEPFGVYSLVTAQYSCELQSKTSRAVVVLSLARTLDDWKITGFYVSPPQPIGR